MAERLLDGRAAVLPAAALGLALAYASARAPLLAVAAVFAAIGAIVVLTRVDLMLLGFIALGPWKGNLDDVPSASLSVIKLTGLLLFCSYVVWAVGRGERLRSAPTLVLAGLLLGWILLSLLASSDPAFGVTTTFSYVLYVAFFFLVLQVVRSVGEIERILRVLTLSTAITALPSIAFFLLGWASRAGIGEPNTYAAFVGSVLPIAAYLYWREPHLRWLWGLAFLSIVGVIFATLSRGALIGIAATLVWAVLARRMRVRGLLAVLAGVAAVLVLAFTFWQPLIDERLAEKEHVASSNVSSRQALWGAAADIGMDHPVLGVGPAMYGPTSDRYLEDEPAELVNPPAHNIFLEVFAENGIPALLLFVAFLGASWAMLQSVHRRGRAAGDVARARLATTLQASLLLTVVAGCFLSIHLTSPVWLLPAFAVVLHRETVSGGHPARATRRDTR